MKIALALEDDVAVVVRAATAESLVLVIAPGRDPLAQAQILASIGPLANEVAPRRRLNAVVPAADATSRRIDAAVVFLESAGSTTGQVWAVG